MEKKIKFKAVASEAIFGTICALIIICFAVSVTIWARPVYYFDINHLQIPQNTGISADECRLNYDALIDYNVLGGTENLIFPTMEMSEQGKIHFEEVKNIFIPMQWIAAVGLVLVILRFIIENRKPAEKKMYLWLHMTVFITFIISSAVLLAVAIDWEWTFETMHLIFFDNDYWIFNPRTDPIIRILPDEFFMHCGVLIALIVLGITIAFERFYRKTRKKYGK